MNSPLFFPDGSAFFAILKIFLFFRLVSKNLNSCAKKKILWVLFVPRNYLDVHEYILKL